MKYVLGSHIRVPLSAHSKTVRSMSFKCDSCDAKIIVGEHMQILGGFSL